MHNKHKAVLGSQFSIFCAAGENIKEADISGEKDLMQIVNIGVIFLDRHETNLDHG